MDTIVAVHKDIFLTTRFFIKGSLSPLNGRLSDHLAGSSGDFLPLRDVVLTGLKDGSITPSPGLLLNPDEILFAHELIEGGGDVYRKVPARESDQQYVKVAFDVPETATLRGKIRRDAFDRSHRSQRFLTLTQPRVEDLPETLEDQKPLLESLSYLILNKRRIAHVFEF